MPSVKADNQSSFISPSIGQRARVGECSVIAHVDMDSYFASVEQQDDPCLQGRPIAVAGKLNFAQMAGTKVGARTVVAAASKEAKRDGVRSGMSTGEAMRLCKELILVGSHSRRYQQIHRRMLSILETFSPQVEVFSIDEWFVDLTGVVDRWGGVESWISRLKKVMRDQFGDVLTCSVGVASNKLVAKLASDVNKPDGHLYLANEQAALALVRRSKLRDFCGVGRRLVARLNRLGVFSTVELLGCSLEILQREFGLQRGAFLYDAVRARDSHVVTSYRDRSREQTIQRSTTLPLNTSNYTYLNSVLGHLTRRVVLALRHNSQFAQTVWIWVRNQDFAGVSLDHKLIEPTNRFAMLYQMATALLVQLPFSGQVRAIGIGVGKLTCTPQLRLWSDSSLVYRDGWESSDELMKLFSQKLITSGRLLQSDGRDELAGYYGRSEMSGKGILTWPNTTN